MASVRIFKFSNEAAARQEMQHQLQIAGRKIVLVGPTELIRTENILPQCEWSEDDGDMYLLIVTRNPVETHCAPP